jgi:uncharacterized protein YktA (UPF0223 family)
MLSVYEFITKLNKFYPSNEKQEIFQERANEYANAIIARSQEKKIKYNYDKVFSHILQNYKYKTFPSLPEIIENLEYGIIIEESYSGHEGETIKRVLNGYEYEFTVVPNHWRNVRTIEQIDEDIKFRTKGGNDE